MQKTMAEKHQKMERPPTGRIELHTWRDFTKVMKVMTAGKWIYRGQEDARWQLKSGLDRYLEKFDKAGQREKDGSRNDLFRSTFPRAEFFAISRFCAMSRDYQEWESYADALIAMQHYGAKTRLLDFTTSLMVALFFAYETQSNGKKRAIYAINYKALLDQDGMWSGYTEFLRKKFGRIDRGDEQARWEFESQIENDYFRQFAFAEANKIISENTQDGVINIIPLYTVCTNKRQMAQTGIELMPRTFDWFDKNLASALKVTVDEINNPEYLVSSDFAHLTNAEAHIPTALVKLVFDAQMEKDAWQFLDQANINAATIYPDLVGVSKSLRYSNSTMIDNAMGLSKDSLTALSCFVPLKRLSTCSMSDTISSVIDKMMENGFSHIPVLGKRRKVIGVFSESTMMEVWRSDLEFSNVKLIRDVIEFLPTKRHKTDDFLFVSKNVTAASLRQMCDESLKREERIGMIFVTENGKEEEPLLGIFTVWDIARVFDLSTPISTQS